jgi:hypothetical protein
MDQRQQDNALAQYMMPVRMISFAFSTSALAFVGIAWLMIEGMGFTALLPLSMPVATAIAVLQLVVILAGYLLSRSIRSAPAARLQGSVAASSSDAARVAEAMQRYVKSVVVSAAFREAACVVGFILTVLTGDLMWVALLATAALISTTVHWPRRAAVEDYLQQQGIVR